jgi:hypothetical protein
MKHPEFEFMLSVPLLKPELLKLRDKAAKALGVTILPNGSAFSEAAHQMEVRRGRRTLRKLPATPVPTVPSRTQKSAPDGVSVGKRGTARDKSHLARASNFGGKSKRPACRKTKKQKHKNA